MRYLFSVLIMSAGSSSRMGGQDKQLLPLLGRPVLHWSVKAFLETEGTGEILVITSPERVKLYESALSSLLNGKIPVKVLGVGGKTRQESVFAGIREISLSASHVAIHDGARPLAKPEDIARVYQDAKIHGAAILAEPAKDTIKLAENGFIQETPPRDRLFHAQTPQVFERAAYLSAMEKAIQAGWDFTDDAQLFEKAGRPVYLTMASGDNMKITTPGDQEMAEAILRKRQSAASLSAASASQVITVPVYRPGFRIGQGYDVHRLVPGRKLILGGVEIPWEKGLLGHSDADVLLHAITDALFGALALGDIGTHFPDTDPAYKGADSRELLRKAVEILREKGWTVGNLDATVIAQAPKLKPFILQMRENIAADLGIPQDQVSVKATTEEGLGITGTGEGISASATVMLLR